MKRICLLLLAVLLASTLVLAACENNKNESSSPESGEEASSVSGTASDSVSDPASDSASDPVSGSDPDKSKPSDESKTENSKPSENSQPEDQIPEGAVEMVYCSFTEKPYFAFVGKCKNGAVVTGKCGGETVTSKSYNGWFSLRLRCDSGVANVTISQTVDGEEFDKPRTFVVSPVTPGTDMWPVITGGDFQFFFQKMLPDYKGEEIPSDYAFDSLKDRVSSRLNQLHAVNPKAEIIYLIIPSSMSVYPELVPASYGTQASVTKLDKTVSALKAGGATVIDLKKLFAGHKNDEKPLYYKLDSHWSDYGAFVAYTELFNHISKKFNAAAPRKADEFNWNPGYYESGDMSYYLAPNASEAVNNQRKIKEYAYYRKFISAPSSITSIQRYRSSTMLCYSDSMTWENVIRTGRSELPSCVVMRDSYSTQIYDLIAERMNNTHFLGMWNYTWDNWLINDEKPDYVIYVIAEWNLSSVIYG